MMSQQQTWGLIILAINLLLFALVTQAKAKPNTIVDNTKDIDQISVNIWKMKMSPEYLVYVTNINTTTDIPDKQFSDTYITMVIMPINATEPLVKPDVYMIYDTLTDIFKQYSDSQYTLALYGTPTGQLTTTDLLKYMLNYDDNKFQQMTANLHVNLYKVTLPPLAPAIE